MKRAKIYLCARVSDDAHIMNDKVIRALSSDFEIFAPHLKEAELKDPKDPLEIYDLDILGMDSADICVTVAPYGKDCSWEMGYFAGAGKPIFMYVPNLRSVPLDEWMVCGGLSVIITDNTEVFEKCQNQFRFLTLFSEFDNIGHVLNRYYKKGGR